MPSASGRSDVPSRSMSSRSSSSSISSSSSKLSTSSPRMRASRSLARWSAVTIELLRRGLWALARHAVQQGGQRSREHDHADRERRHRGGHDAEVTELDEERRRRFVNEVHAEKAGRGGADETNDRHGRKAMEGAALAAQHVAVE